MSANISSESTNEYPSFKHILNLPDVDFILLSWIAGIIFSVSTVLIIIGNGLVIAAILMDPLRIIRRHPSNHLVLSLAAADFFVGAFISSTSAWWFLCVALYKKDLSDVVDRGTGVRSMDLIAISTINTLALGVDRLIAVQAPMKYAYRVTKLKVRIIILCIWGYFAVLSPPFYFLLQRFDPKLVKREFIFNCHGTVAFLALVFVSIFIIYFHHKQSRATKRRFESSVLRRKVVQRDKKVTTAVVLLILIFFVCFIPFFICQLLEQFCSVCLHKWVGFFLVFRTVSMILICFNSFINPFVYALRMPKYAGTLKYLSRKCLKC